MDEFNDYITEENIGMLKDIAIYIGGVTSTIVGLYVKKRIDIKAGIHEQHYSLKKTTEIEEEKALVKERITQNYSNKRNDITKLTEFTGKIATTTELCIRNGKKTQETSTKNIAETLEIKETIENYLDEIEIMYQTIFVHYDSPEFEGEYNTWKNLCTVIPNIHQLCLLKLTISLEGIDKSLSAEENESERQKLFQIFMKDEDDAKKSWGKKLYKSKDELINTYSNLSLKIRT